jgi:hypothetical protein
MRVRYLLVQCGAKRMIQLGRNMELARGGGEDKYIKSFSGVGGGKWTNWLTHA